MPDRHDADRRSRRDFLKGTTAAAATLGLGRAGAHASPAAGPAAPAVGSARPAAAPEWRNRHPDMTYRVLGRTGFMVSEVVYGGYLMKPHTVDLYEAALDRGLNFLDQAISYGNGDGERAIGTLLKRGVSRDRFFLTSKLSHYNGFVRRVYGDHLKTLTGDQQAAVQARAQTLFAEHRPTRTGYHVNYFGGQEKPMDGTYLVNAMKELGFAAGTKKQFKDKIFDQLDESMARTTADHYDVLYCPHSVESPAAFDDEALTEALAEIKQSGKARALGFSCHNDTGAILSAGTATGTYDVAMVAYNLVNHLAMDPVIAEATAAGVGVIAMKAARPVVIDALDWRIAKLHAMIPGDDLSVAQKAYLFVLQNPDLSAVISDMGDVAMLTENLALAGRKTELNWV